MTKMPGPDLTSIPLPEGVEDFSTIKTKKSAREMLQKALRDHKIPAKEPNSNTTCITPSNINKLAGALGPQIKMSSANFQSSQSIVDELFKDFISQKMSSKMEKVVTKEVSKPKTSSSVEEMSKILDMEINSLRSQSADSLAVGEKSEKSSHKHKKSKSSKSSKSHSSRSKKKSSVEDLSKEQSEKSEKDLSEKSYLPVSHPSVNTTLSVPSGFVDSKLHTEPNDNSCTSLAITTTISTANPSCEVTVTCHEQQQNSQSSESDNKDQQKQQEQTVIKPPVTTSVMTMLPAPLAKKMAPKLLGLKLSEQSLSLIKSNDRIDREGRVWEEGELTPSLSGNSEMSNSGNDGYPSETGSIDSNAEDWRSQTTSKHKKKKQKHKKKKKKSSREKDRDSESKEKCKREDEMAKDKDGKGKTSTSDKEVVKQSSIKDKADTDNVKDRKHRESKRSSKSKDDSNSTDDGKKSKDDKQRSEKSRGLRRSNEERKRKRSRSISPKRKKRSRSSSRSPRSLKRNKQGSHYSEWDARCYGDDKSKDARSRSRSRSRSPRGHKRHSKDKSILDNRNKESRDTDRDLRLQIDKAKLRKIAIANALQNMKTGQGPQVADVVTIKSGGKSVAELTDFCKKISQKDKDRRESDVSDSSDEEPMKNSDDEETLIHHPFKVKDTSSSNIIMNIRNAKQLPVLTPTEKQVQQATLRLTFPVSSGSHHRDSESEWVPVEKTTVPKTPVQSKATISTMAMPPPPAPAPPEPLKKADSIFPDQEDTKKLDIGSIISERLQAVRKLQQNPFDVQALTKMHQVQQQASKWATSKHLPGQFMGSTGVQILSQEQLIGDRRHQAWAKKVAQSILLRQRPSGV